MNEKSNTKQSRSNLLQEEQEVDAMYYSRPLSLPGCAFGSINIFFDPSELAPEVVEGLGKYVTSAIELYFRTGKTELPLVSSECTSKKECLTCSTNTTNTSKKRILN